MKKIIVCLLVSLVAFLPMAATAADKKAEVKEKEEYTGRVLLEYEKYPPSHYKIETDVGDGILDSPDRALASLVNGIWILNREIANFSIFAIDQLMSFDLIDLVIDEAAIISENIFNSMTSTFLSLFIVIAGGTTAYRLLMSNRQSQAIKAILSSLIVLIACLWFFSDTKGHITWLNDLSSDLEGIAASTNVLMTAENKNQDKPYDQQEGYAVLKNQLFNLMIKQPYLYLNYGTTKESSIIKEDPDRVTKLLKLKPYSEEGKEQREDIVKEEVKEHDNVRMTTDFSGERFGTAILSLITTLTVAIPFVGIAGLKFLLQVFFLVALIFTAIPLVFSLLPSYSETAVNHFKRIVSIAFYKAVLILLLSVITGILTILYETLKLTSGLQGHMLLVFVTALVTFGIVKYKDQILETASVGFISGENAADRIQSNLKQFVSNTADKGNSMLQRVTQSKQTKREQSSRRDEKANRNTAASNNGLQLVEGGKSQQREAGIKEFNSSKQQAAAGSQESQSKATYDKKGVNSQGEQKQSSQRQSGLAKEDVKEARQQRVAERHGENEPNHFQTNPHVKNPAALNEVSVLAAARNPESTARKTTSEVNKKPSEQRNSKGSEHSQRKQQEKPIQKDYKHSPNRNRQTSEPIQKPFKKPRKRQESSKPANSTNVSGGHQSRLNQTERKEVNRMSRNE